MPKTQSSKHVGPISKSHLRSSESLTRRPLRAENEHSEESSEEENEENSFSKTSPSTAPDEDKIGQQKATVHKPFIQKKTAVPNPSLPEKAISSYYIYFVAMIFICVGAFYVCKLGIQSEMKAVDVSQILADMENHFDQQSAMTYRFIKSQLKKVVNVADEPSAPAIITLIANKGAENTASEFSQHLAKALAPGKYISINDSTYWKNDPDEIRFKIDEEIKSKYHQDKLTVIVVDKLNNIPFESAMIFHGYCDHELSPYKRAVFLFIVPLNTVIPEDSTNKHLDSVAMDSLKDIWHSATDDKVDSLITRMTVAVVHIK